MENLIIYTDRYKSVKSLERNSIKLSRLFAPKTGDIDSFIDSVIINKILSNDEYQNIFLPISPFSGFTVYIGLRIAMHIKLCNNKNRHSNVFLFASEYSNQIFKNNLSDILKFKEVEVIDYSKEQILEKIDSPITCDENLLFRQINKLNMNIPSDYYDNHSIANEWGIYQLARNANVDIEEITDFNLIKLNRLYFKWLIKKNKLDENLSKQEVKEQEIFRIRLKGLKIIGKID